MVNTINDFLISNISVFLAQKGLPGGNFFIDKGVGEWYIFIMERKGDIMRDFYSRNRENINKVIYISLLFIFVVIFCKYLMTYFTPFILGYIICFITYPLAKFLNIKLRLPKPLASAVCILAFIFLIGVVGANIVTEIIEQGTGLIDNFPEFLKSFYILINEFLDKIRDITDFVPESLRFKFDDFVNSFIENLAEILTNTFKDGSLNIVKKVPNFVMVIALGIVASFFILNDRENIDSFVKRQIPESVREKFVVAKNGIKDALGGYVKAQLTIMCVMMAIIFIGLSIIGSPYALVLCLIIGVFDALPFFGSGAFFIPWAIYDIFTGNYVFAIGLLIIYCVLIVTRQFLEPRILSKHIGIHPVATLLSIYIGLRTLGVFGFILGPMILVIIKALQESDLLPKWK